MDDVQALPDWALRVRELNQKIGANAEDSARWAAEKRALVRQAAQTLRTEEIAQILGVTPGRVSQMLGRVEK